MVVEYLDRDDWDGGPVRRGHAVPHAQFIGLAAHHTVFVMQDYDRDGFLHGDIDDIIRYMKTLQTIRAADLGPEVPYSFIVFEGENDQDCIVAEGRGFGRTGAHTHGFNSTRYGVAVAGNTSTRRITQGMIQGFNWVGAKLNQPVGAATTFGHRDVKNTECPGDSLYDKLDLIQPPFTIEEDKDWFDMATRTDAQIEQLFKDVLNGAFSGENTPVMAKFRERMFEILESDRGQAVLRQAMKDQLNDSLDNPSTPVALKIIAIVRAANP